VATESMSDAVKMKTKCASLACALRPMETRATCWRGCPLSHQRTTPFRFATRLIAARKLSHKVNFRAAATGQLRTFILQEFFYDESFDYIKCSLYASTIVLGGTAESI
jgi:hypothetical protein